MSLGGGKGVDVLSSRRIVPFGTICRLYSS